MKLNKFANLLVIGLVLTVAASGCRKKPVNVTELPGARAGRKRAVCPPSFPSFVPRRSRRSANQESAVTSGQIRSTRPDTGGSRRPPRKGYSAGRL